MQDDDPFAHPANALVLAVFRLNGALIARGDALVAPLGLTSARWQVMGAVARGTGGLSVAQVARNMGLTRQAVQRIVDDLAGEGLVGFAPNPHHKRAKLVRLTPEGQQRFGAALALWTPIADRLAEEAGRDELSRLTARLEAIRSSLAPSSPTDGDET